MELESGFFGEEGIKEEVFKNYSRAWGNHSLVAGFLYIYTWAAVFVLLGLEWESHLPACRRLAWQGARVPRVEWPVSRVSSWVGTGIESPGSVSEGKSLERQR